MKISLFWVDFSYVEVIEGGFVLGVFGFGNAKGNG